MSGFTKQLMDFTGAQREDIEKALRTTSLRVFGQVVSVSPVDTGRFRSSWQVAVDTPNLETRPGGKSGSPSPEPPQVIQGNVEYDSTIYISNNTEYGAILEDERGFIASVEPAMEEIWDEEMRRVIK